MRYRVNVDRGITVDGEHKPLFSEFEHEPTAELEELTAKGFVIACEPADHAAKRHGWSRKPKQ